MSTSHIFPVKAEAFIKALRPLKERIELHNRACNAKPVGADDGKIRMSLNSPEFAVELGREMKLKYFRARLAFDAVPPAFGFDKGYLEVYDSEGTLFAEPTALPDIEVGLGNAIQVELFQFLLKAHGVDIPML